jgi:molybdopterin-containing oxidoreductase family iron-sulfur binding subunit
MACKVENGTQHGLYWCNMNYKEEGTYSKVKKLYQPVQCNHCAEAPCLEVCPVGATYREKDGTVQTNQDECIGCESCVVECPYKMRQFNYDDPAQNPAYGFGKDYWGNNVGLTPFELAKANRHQFQKAEKCTFCAGRRADNQQPACVEACLVTARVFGDLDDPKSDLNREIKRLKAKPLNADSGDTKPSVYYAGKY